MGGSITALHKKKHGLVKREWPKVVQANNASWKYIHLVIQKQGVLVQTWGTISQVLCLGLKVTSSPHVQGLGEAFTPIHANNTTPHPTSPAPPTAPSLYMNNIHVVWSVGNQPYLKICTWAHTCTCTCVGSMSKIVLEFEDIWRNKTLNYSWQHFGKYILYMLIQISYTYSSIYSLNDI